MGYDIRPLATLSTQARLFFTQSVPGAVVKLWANTFVVFGKVFALLDFEHELRRQYLYKQLFASTAAQQWLTRHGYELGIVQDPGNFAAGQVSASCAPSVLVPAGIQYVRADGATYTSLAAATATAGSVDLHLQADLAGAAFNMDPGDALALTVAAGVPIELGSVATVDGDGLNGGADPESLEEFRARILYRKRNVPQGGSIPDYVKWVGEALASVDQVYVDSFANDSRGVWVCFTVSDQANRVPSIGEVEIVQDYVDDPIRRPVTARVFVMAPHSVSLPVVIANLSPDTPDVRVAIEIELEALQTDVVRPATPSTPFVMYREEIEAAIKRAVGSVGRFTLAAPAADLIYATAADMPTLDAISFA